MTQKFAVTGGTGFVGAALISEILARGGDAAALARTPKKLARADEMTLIEGSLESDDALARLADGADVFIHCAGLTRARREEDFFAVNVEGARRAARAAASAGATFVHISSMAARKPDLSAYAASKRAAEDAVAGESIRNPCIALRLPAIYGPGDEATLPYFKLIKRGLAPEPAADPAPRASILYVEDIAAAILCAAEKAPPGVYEVGDESADGHSWREIGEALAAAMRVKVRRLPAPRILLSSIAALGSGAARLAGGAPIVTPGKIREFFHPDWVARDRLLCDAVSWRPQTPLQEGFAKTVRWYQENGLL